MPARLLLTPKGVILGLAGLALAGLATLDAAVAALTPVAPKAAAGRPGGTSARITLLDRKLVANLLAPLPRNTRQVARAALRVEPLDPVALHLLAFSADPKGQSARAVEFARLANRVTRRDLLSQLILIDHAARSGQAGRALDHYDAALRAHPSSRPVVFPILKKALASPSIRRDLAPYFVSRAPWARDFTFFAIDDRQAVRLVSEVVIQAGPMMGRQDLAFGSPPILTRLIEARAFAEVSALLRLVPGGDPRLLQQAEWTAASTDPAFGLAAWQLASTATSSATFVLRDGVRVLSVYAASGGNAVVASKVLALSPGTYALRQEMELAETGSGARAAGERRAQWRVVCLSADNNATIWQGRDFLSVPGRQIHNDIIIPESCPHQRLDLVVQASFDAPALDLSLSNFKLTRASQ
ncbi:MAG TPA: hypothetical protein PKD92_01800 [Novosphingobium sp.]|nr:hypothetical protein [Novosphingobium sp.]